MTGALTLEQPTMGSYSKRRNQGSECLLTSYHASKKLQSHLVLIPPAIWNALVQLAVCLTRIPPRKLIHREREQRRSGGDLSSRIRASEWPSLTCMVTSWPRTPTTKKCWATRRVNFKEFHSLSSLTRIIVTRTWPSLLNWWRESEIAFKSRSNTGAKMAVWSG